MHIFLHVLGIDTQQSYWYDFWSGIATQFSLVLAGAATYHKHNCHHKRCIRIGKHNVNGTPWCIKHHPESNK
jgi:hypothetical protein